MMVSTCKHQDLLVVSHAGPHQAGQGSVQGSTRIMRNAAISAGEEGPNRGGTHRDPMAWVEDVGRSMVLPCHDHFLFTRRAIFLGGVLQFQNSICGSSLFIVVHLPAYLKTWAESYSSWWWLVTSQHLRESQRVFHGSLYDGKVGYYCFMIWFMMVWAWFEWLSIIWLSTVTWLKWPRISLMMADSMVDQGGSY